MKTNLIWDIEYTPSRSSTRVKGVISAIVAVDSAIVAAHSKKAALEKLRANVGNVQILKCLPFNRFLYF